MQSKKNAKQKVHTRKDTKGFIKTQTGITIQTKMSGLALQPKQVCGLDSYWKRMAQQITFGGLSEDAGDHSHSPLKA